MGLFGFFSGNSHEYQSDFGKFDIAALVSTRPLSRAVQEHLFNVYTVLLSGVFCCVIGVVLDLYLYLGGIISSVASFLLLSMLAFKTDGVSRLWIFLALAICNGLSLGGLVSFALHVNRSIVILALLGTACIFLGMSIAARYTSNRGFLYLGGLLTSAVGYLSIISIFNAFSRSYSLYNLQLYLGLTIFVAYVCFDTQVIIQRASLGDFDVVGHALKLFQDLFAVFVRLVTILIQQNTQSNSRKKESRRNYYY